MAEADQENETCEDCDPFLLEDHLIELRECHKFSKSVFFIVSIHHHICYAPTMQQELTHLISHNYLCVLQTLLGTEIGNLMPPTSIDSATYDAVLRLCADEAEINLLQNCYGKKTISSSPSSTLLRTEKGHESTEKYVLSRDYR